MHGSINPDSNFWYNFKQWFELLDSITFNLSLKVSKIPWLKSFEGNGGNLNFSPNTSPFGTTVTNGAQTQSNPRTTSKTAPARLEGLDDDVEEEDSVLFKVQISRNLVDFSFKHFSDLYFRDYLLSNTTFVFVDLLFDNLSFCYSYFNEVGYLHTCSKG